MTAVRPKTEKTAEECREQGKKGQQSKSSEWKQKWKGGRQLGAPQSTLYLACGRQNSRTSRKKTEEPAEQQNGEVPGSLGNHAVCVWQTLLLHLANRCNGGGVTQTGLLLVL